MKSKLLILLVACLLSGCCSAPEPARQPQPSQDEWPVLGWDTNTPLLNPVTNSVPR